MKRGYSDLRDLCRRAGVRVRDGEQALKGARIPHSQLGRAFWIPNTEIRRFVALLREVRAFVRQTSPARLLNKPVTGPLAKLIEDQVYFIQSGDFVKIGYGNNVKTRLSKLQVGSPHELVLVHHHVGNRDDEASYHRRFAKYHYRAEWFKIKGDLAEFLAKARQRIPEKVPHVEKSFSE